MKEFQRVISAAVSIDARLFFAVASGLLLPWPSAAQNDFPVPPINSSLPYISDSNVGSVVASFGMSGVWSNDCSNSSSGRAEAIQINSADKFFGSTFAQGYVLSTYSNSADAKNGIYIVAPVIRAAKVVGDELTLLLYFQPYYREIVFKKDADGVREWMVKTMDANLSEFIAFHPVENGKNEQTGQDTPELKQCSGS